VSIPHEEHVVNRSAAAIAAVCIACAALPAAAGELVDVAVISRATGQRAPVHHHQGRMYVAGTPGERYAVYVANRTAGRLLTVVSVDGINAVTGETASADQNGYVLGPHQSYEIAGWRKSTSEVAAFYFTQLPDSYAARTDRPENVGVIGVAVFREYRPPRPAVLPQPRPYARSDGAAREAESSVGDAAGAPAASAPAESTAEARTLRRQEKIGTGHGERERSEVVYTHFRRATSHPNETIAIHYDTRANLVARGIIPGSAPVSTPNPFPGGRFVPDPRT
jgi:hypothetical protein